MGSSLFKQADSVNPTEKPEQVFINDLVSSNDLVIFSRSNCGYCVKAKSLLDRINMKYEALDLDDHKKCPGEDCTSVIQNLMLLTRMRTVPQIFYKGQLIGGYTELEKMVAQGSFPNK